MAWMKDYLNAPNVPIGPLGAVNPGQIQAHQLGEIPNAKEQRESELAAVLASGVLTVGAILEEVKRLTQRLAPILVPRPPENKPDAQRLYAVPLAQRIETEINVPLATAFRLLVELQDALEL